MGGGEGRRGDVDGDAAPGGGGLLGVPAAMSESVCREMYHVTDARRRLRSAVLAVAARPAALKSAFG